LPAPFAVGLRVFAFEGIGEVDGAPALAEVLLVEEFDPFEMSLEEWFHALGEDGDTVFEAFAFADEDLVGFEVDVFDAEADAFHEAHAGAVEEGGHEAEGAGHAGEDPVSLGFGEDDGEAGGAFGAVHVLEGAEILPEDLAVEEKQGVESLVLGGGGEGIPAAGRVREGPPSMDRLLRLTEYGFGCILSSSPT
jgi:hypothetical protein